MFREKIKAVGAYFTSCDGYDFEMEDKEFQSVLENPVYRENSISISKSFKKYGGAKEARNFIESL